MSMQRRSQGQEDRRHGSGLVDQRDGQLRARQGGHQAERRVVRADEWIQAAGAADIIKAVPESYLLGDRAIYVDAFLACKDALSADGTIPEGGAAAAVRALQSVDDSLKGVKFDLAAASTNEFVEKANLKYPTT
jgi:hypothetical protein